MINMIHRGRGTREGNVPEVLGKLADLGRSSNSIFSKSYASHALTFKF